MFLKQYNYQPKQPATAAAADTANQANPATESGTTAANRRRSSAADKFAGLTSHKRNSQDQAAADRRSSFADQKPGGAGVLGSMWSNFTKGS